MRTREDIDTLFLSVNIQEARSLKPALDYNYYEGMDVFLVNDWQGDINFEKIDKDLEGVISIDIPFMLPTPLPEDLKVLNNKTRYFAIGYDALSSLQSGSACVAIGKEALKDNVQSNNTAVGRGASVCNTTGLCNTSVGGNALACNTTGCYNSAFGRDALCANTTASNNTAVGKEALKVNTTGACNIAMGSCALIANTTGSYNTAIGDSLYCIGGGNALIIFNGAPHNPGIIYKVKVPVKIATDSLLTEIYFKSES